MTSIRFNVPFITANEDAYVAEAIRSADFTSDSLSHKKASALLGKIYGTDQILLTSSCTHALEMIAIAMNIQEGDEVIMSSFTFMSTANAFVLRGARIVFAPVDPSTMNIDLLATEKLITSKTKAIVLMHYAGISCNMDQCIALSEKYNIPLVEDAAHCIGATWKGKALGTFGEYGTLSFHHTKNIHCAEGGALITKNPNKHRLCKSILEKGTNRTDFENGLVDSYNWVRLGSSYAMSALNSAFLAAQLEELNTVTQARRKLWYNYFNNLESLVPAITLPSVPKEANHNGHIFYIKCKNKEERNLLITHLKENGISAYFHYPALHDSPAGKEYGTMPLRGAEAILESERLLRLPIYPNLDIESQDRISSLIIQFYTS